MKLTVVLTVFVAAFMDVRAQFDVECRVELSTTINRRSTTNRKNVTSGDQRDRRQVSADLQKVIIDYGRLIVQNCPPMLCTGLDCALVTERNGCQLCACPIGSPSRGCDPMPFVLWHDLMVKGCPAEGGDVDNRRGAQKVTRWFRRVNRFTGTDQCESYVFPYCQELDYNLWRSPRTKEECQFYCYSFEEQRARGNQAVGQGVEN